MASKVLLPLYIYPHPHAWDPLYKAIETRPKLSFLIIINPSSGPGSAPWWPNEDYVREVPRLNSYPNVTILGYVRATYCKREICDVLEDIKTYAARGSQRESNGSARDNGRLEMQGIFVDETVNLYTEEMKTYLDGIDEVVRGCEGIGGSNLVVHNPGTAVSRELADPGPDVTVVVETSYAEFVKDEYQAWLATSPYEKGRSCYMVHSVPEERVRSLTKELREKADYLFVTSAKEKFYEGFGDSWIVFIAAMGE